MKQELVKLANHLDSLGHRDLADRLDEILKLAEGEAYSGEEEEGEGGEYDEGTDEILGAIGDETLEEPPTSLYEEEPAPFLDDTFAASKTAEDRISKLAELMAGEFNTHIPGTFSR